MVGFLFWQEVGILISRVDFLIFGVEFLIFGSFFYFLDIFHQFTGFWSGEDPDFYGIFSFGTNLEMGHLLTHFSSFYFRFFISFSGRFGGSILIIFCFSLLALLVEELFQGLVQMEAIFDD